MRFYRVGVCLRSRQEAPYTSEFAQSLEAAAAEAADSMEIFAVEASSLNETSSQKDIILRFAEDKLDLVIIDAADADECGELAATLESAGIPVIFVNNMPSIQSPSPGSVLRFVGFDLFRGGSDIAQHLFEILGKNHKALVLDAFDSEQARGFIAGARASFVLESVLRADNDELKTVDLLRQHLRDGGKFSLVFAASDDMALSAAAFLSEAGRGDILISGFNSNIAGKAALRRQKLACSAHCDFHLLSQAVIDAARAVLAGAKSDMNILVPMEILTSELFAREDRPVERRAPRLVRPSPDLSEVDYESLSHQNFYPILLGGSFTEDLAPRLGALGASNHFVVVDDNAADLYGDRLTQALGAAEGDVEIFAAAIKAGEGIFTPLNDLLSRMIDRGMSIGSSLTLVGGASLMTLGALASAVFGRGIKIVLVPTTPLSQIDCVSLSVMELMAVRAISLVGQSYDPSFVLIDGEFVRSLPTAVQRGGFVEAVRAGLLRAPEILSALERGSYGSVLSETLAIKTSAPLNGKDSAPAVSLYAEPIARAIEFAAEGELCRAEALSLAMITCAEISQRMGFAGSQLRFQHERSLGGIGLPLTLNGESCIDKVIDRIYSDRRERRTHASLILLEEPGRLHVLNGKRLIPVPEKLMREALLSLVLDRALAKAV